MRKILLTMTVLIAISWAMLNHPNSLSIDNLTTGWDGEYPMRFIVLGDNYGMYANFSILRQQMALLADSIDFVITTGDHASEGDVPGYDNYMAAIDSVDIPWVTTMGNHEINDSLGWDRYLEYFGSPNYYFDLGNSRFISMTNCYQASEPVSGTENIYYKFTDGQLDTLEMWLEDHDGPEFLFIHSPPKLSGHINIACVGGIGSAPGTAESNTVRFTDILRDYGVYSCFIGHFHIFDRWVAGTPQYGDVNYIITGGGGATLTPWPYPAPMGGSFYHFLVMELYEDGRLDGHVVLADTDGDSIIEVEYALEYEFSLEYTGIEEIAQGIESPQLKCSPNPFNAVLQVEKPLAQSSVTIRDLGGRVVHRQDGLYGQREFTWTPSYISAGWYFISCGESKRRVLYLP